MSARIVESQHNLLPHDVEAEEAVIGSILIDPDALMRCQEAGLAPDDFHTRRLGWVYEAAQALALRGEPTDPIAVAREMSKETDADGNRLDLLGGMSALSELVSLTATTIYAGHHAESVKRDARRRRLIAAGAEVSAASHLHDGDLGELYDHVSQILFAAMERSDAHSHLYGGADALDGYMANQDRRRELLERDPDALIRTHLLDIDRLIGDMQPGQLVVVGANTSVGKTMLMEQVAEANAKRGHTIAYYHLEQSHQAMMDRCVARYTGVPTWRLRQGYVDTEVERAMADIRTWHDNITYVHCPGWTAERIVADIMRLHATGRCELPIIDYLGKVKLTDNRGYNSSKLVGLQVEAFKTVAEQLGVPLVLGSQVSRFFKTTAAKRPTMDDLRDSGEIEEKANLVIMLHNPTAREDRDQAETSERIEAHLEKNTDGPLGKANLLHLKGRFLLADYTSQEQPEEVMFNDASIPF